MSPLDPATQPDALPHAMLLATAGGLLDAIVYLLHGHVFANAMTGNIVFLGIATISRTWSDIIPHLAPLAGFFAGGLTSKYLRTRLGRPPASPTTPSGSPNPFSSPSSRSPSAATQPLLRHRPHVRIEEPKSMSALVPDYPKDPLMNTSRLKENNVAALTRFNEHRNASSTPSR
jgi:hypothetical protein